MRKLFSFSLLIFFSSYCYSQREVFDTDLNNFSYDLILNDLYYSSLLGKEDKFAIKPRIFSATSVNNELKFNSYVLGLSFSSHVNKKIVIESVVDKIEDDYNPLLIKHLDSLNIYPLFGKEKISFQIKASYLLNKFFTINIGKGRNFIGEGYRSLLLSSNHGPYPYFKFKTSFGRVKYYNLFTTFLDMRELNQDRKKHSSIHFLDYQISDNIRVGVFESVLWRSKDDSYNRGYDIEYLNPIIFFRPVEYSKNSPDNVLIGLNFSVDIDRFNIYSQVLLDDLNISRQKERDDNYSGGFFQNKYGFQLGSRFKLEDLYFLIEYNQAQPYTYAHKDPMQTYTHLNQSLAHPLGANFKEMVFLSEYNINRFTFRFKYINAKVGLDSINTHYGQNIFLSDFEAELDGQEYSYGNFNGQGVLTSINSIQFDASYSFNVIDIFGSVNYRRCDSDLVKYTNVYYSLGIRTFPFTSFSDY